METNYEALEQAHCAIARDRRDRIGTDLKGLARDAQDLLKATGDTMSETAKAARERLGATLDRARTACAKLQSQTVAVGKKADKVVRDHPYRSMGAVFGLGLLVGMIMRRK